MNYNSQLKAWALDRAIETFKMNETKGVTAELLTELADKFCAYTHDAEGAAIEAEVKAKAKAQAIEELKDEFKAQYEARHIESAAA